MKILKIYANEPEKNKVRCLNNINDGIRLLDVIEELHRIKGDTVTYRATDILLINNHYNKSIKYVIQ